MWLKILKLFFNVLHNLLAVFWQGIHHMAHNHHHRFLCSLLYRNIHMTSNSQIYLMHKGDLFQYRKISDSHRGHIGALHFPYTLLLAKWKKYSYKIEFGSFILPSENFSGTQPFSIITYPGRQWQPVIE